MTTILPAYGPPKGTLIGYLNNVSNIQSAASNVVTISETNVNLPLNGLGNNNEVWSTVKEGKLNLDTSFNGGAGGIIVDKLNNQTNLAFRISLTRQGAPVPTANVSAKAVLLSDKTDPNSVVARTESANYRFFMNNRQHILIDSFHGGIEAVRIEIECDIIATFRVDGVRFFAQEAW